VLNQQGHYGGGVSESGILSRVRDFIEDNAVYGQRGFMVADDERFLKKAAMDSRYIIAIVNFIEDEFGVLVSNCEITEENLGSLRAVARFVASKQPFAVG
jgi:acyl carrier protein